jgi:hypothetical protein
MTFDSLESRQGAPSGRRCGIPQVPRNGRTFSALRNVKEPAGKGRSRSIAETAPRLVRFQLLIFGLESDKGFFG